jgi:hypothetical protein
MGRGMGCLRFGVEKVGRVDHHRDGGVSSPAEVEQVLDEELGS